MSKRIEIEMRSIFDKKKFDSLKKFLIKKAKFLGQDNKNVHFFIFPNKLLKVSDEILSQKAKITLKLNKIGKGSNFEEVEVSINREDVASAVKLFKQIGFINCVYMNDFQKRYNYLYKGVELALKYSKVWGYHLELEILVNNTSKKKAAEFLIRKLAQELNVKIMTDKELREFTNKAEKSWPEKQIDEKAKKVFT